MAESSANSSGSSYPVRNTDPHAKQVDSIYEQRLRHFIDDRGQYADINLPKFYDRARVFDPNVSLKVYEVPGAQDRPLFKEVVGKVKFDRDVHKGDWFGPSWKTFWFKVVFQVPKDWKNEEQVWFQWDSSSEALVYSEDGDPLQAFTGGERTDYILPKKYRDTAKKHTVYIEMACNGMFGVGMGSDIAPPDENRFFQLHVADLVVPNLKARALRIDYLLITDAAREFSGDSWQKYKARQVATEINDAFDYNDESSIDTCLKIAREYIGDEAHSSEVYSTNPLGKVDVFAIGNCHIDTAWLWPFAETRRKIVRSWTTQLNLIDTYPEYQFVASQAQQFKWLKEDHPRVFERLSAAVKDGRFVPIGGSWVEHDTNIPGGESLVRQFSFGQRFFQREFGLRANTFWLPDTFGYSSQIPQLCRLAGFTNFLTQKLSWNNINRFPNTSFNWVGIDGSQVLVHMPPDDTYTADANFGDVKRSISNHKNLSSNQTGLLCYGKGDGGGGPLPEMLEKLRRCRAISNTVGLLPSVNLQTEQNTVDEFFKSLLRTSDNGKKLPTWVGELYFEFHRGTYTSQALVKKLMRKNEIRLHDLEYFATLASIYTDYKYPYEEIQSIWEDVLLCQFHDVLPGSCIGLVYYNEVHPMLKNAAAKSSKLIDKALAKLDGFSKEKYQDFEASERELVLFNTLPWPREGVFKIPSSIASTINLDIEFPHQAGAKSSYFYGKTDPESGIIIPVYDHEKVEHPAKIIQRNKDEIILTNSRYEVLIKKGIVISIYDHLTKFELLDQSKGGIQYVLLKDTPLNWQAWDTELYSLDVIEPLKPDSSPTINEDGPLRVSVLLKQKISKESTIKTIISLDAITSTSKPNQSPLTFTSSVDWNESRKFLKVQFPVSINSPFATHETQFGLTSRPTHNNTTWDVAKFESVHHKFIDLSNSNRGVSILNDSKYGGGVLGNLITLSLLRAPKQPDADADMGKHTFKFGILGHSGPVGPTTIKAGYEFNHPVFPKSIVSKKNGDSLSDSDYDVVHVRESTTIDAVYKFSNFIKLTSDEDNLILSNLKRQDDDFVKNKLSRRLVRETEKDDNDLSVIVRIYESLGGFGVGKLTINPPSGLKLVKGYKVNLLEDEIEEVVLDSNNESVDISVNTKEFEVVSYKLKFKKCVHDREH